MKYILDIGTFEAVGVPDNITQTSSQIFDLMIKKIESRPVILKLAANDCVTFNFVIRGNFIVSDLRIEEIMFDFTVYASDEVNEISLIAMKCVTDMKKELGKQGQIRLKNIGMTNPKIEVHIAGPEGMIKPCRTHSKDKSFECSKCKSLFFDNFPLLDFLADNEVMFVSSIAHELHHDYDNFKAGYTNPKEFSEYSGIQKTTFDIPSLDEFLEYLYICTRAERLVYSSETYTAAFLRNIGKSDFLEFIRGDENYKLLKEIGEFSFDKMIQKLFTELKEIDEFFEEVDFDHKSMSDIEKVDTVLRIFYQNITDFTIDEYKKYLVETQQIEFMGKKFPLGISKIPTNLEEDFKKFKNKVKRFGGYERFFRFYEKHLKFVSEKAIKKISKIYSLL